MNKEEYTKYYSQESWNSSIFGVILPLIIILILLVTFSAVQDKQTFGYISQVLPFSYIPFFLFAYYLRPFGIPKFKPSEFFFDKVGWEKLAIRHIALKKLYGKTIRFLIYSIIFSVIFLYITLSTQNQNAETLIKFNDFLISIIFIPGMMVFSMKIVMWLVNNRVDYFFYLSKAYFKIAFDSKFLEEIQQSAWILNGLYAYKKYIKRNILLNIDNVETIYSKIISTSDQSMNQSLQTILDKFENHKKIDLLRYLLSLDDT